MASNGEVEEWLISLCEERAAKGENLRVQW